MKLCKKTSQFRISKHRRLAIALAASILLTTVFSLPSLATPLSTPFLSVDINGQNGETAALWESWNFNAYPAGPVGVPVTNTFGDVTVSITPIGIGFDSRNREGTTSEPLKDFIYTTRDTNIGLGQHLLILEFSGLEANTSYEFTFLGKDIFNTTSTNNFMAVDIRDPRNYSSYSPMTGSPLAGTLLGRFPIVGTNDFADIYDYSSSFFVTTDDTGHIILYTWNDSDTSWEGQLVSLLGGFEIGHISSFIWGGTVNNVWTAADNWLGASEPTSEINGPLYFGNMDTGDKIITGVDDDHTEIVSINFAGASGNFTINGIGSFSIISNGTIGNGNGGHTHTFNLDFVSNDVGIVVNGTDNLTINGDISGDGGLRKEGTAILQLNGTNTYTGDTTLTAGILSLDGTLDSEVIVNGGRFMGGGTIYNNFTVNSGGTAAPGNSIGTLIIDGDFTLNTGAIFEAEILKVDSTLSSDLLDITGTATLALNSTIRVLNLSQAGVITDGDTFTIISADGGVTDSGVSVLHNSVLLNFTSEISGNDYIITAEIKDVTSENSLALFNAIGEDYFTATGDYANIIAILDSLGDAAINKAGQMLSPITHASIRDFNIQMAQDLASDLGGYLAARRHGTKYMAKYESLRQNELLMADASGNPQMLTYVVGETERLRQQLEEADKEIHTFVRPFGIWANHDSSKEYAGFSAQSYGAQFGIDKIFRGNWILGFGGSYNHSMLDFDKGAGDATVDSFRVGPYASYFEDRWHIDGSATIGYHLNKTHRDIKFPGLNRTADADYYAWDFSVYLGAGYDFSFKKWTLTPSASIQYTRYRNETFEEEGAGDAGLDVEAVTQESLLSTLGLRLYTNTTLYDIRLSPELFVGYSHEFMDQENISSRFVNGTAKFTTNIDNDRKDSLYYGAGLTGLISDKTSAFFRYECETFGGNDNTALKAGLTIIF